MACARSDAHSTPPYSSLPLPTPPPPRCITHVHAALAPVNNAVGDLGAATATANANATQGMVPSIPLPKYFSSEWSFAQFRVQVGGGARRVAFGRGRGGGWGVEGGPP